MRAVVGLFIVIVLLLLGVACLGGPGEGRHPAPGEVRPVAGSGRWAIAADRDALEELRADPRAEGRLRAAGRLAGVQAGQTMILERRDGDAWLVQVGDGPKVGQRGWVSTKAVGRATE